MSGRVNDVTPLNALARENERLQERIAELEAAAVPIANKLIDGSHGRGIRPLPTEKGEPFWFVGEEDHA